MIMNISPRRIPDLLLLFAILWLANGIDFLSAEDLTENEAIHRLKFDLDRVFSDDRFSGAQWGVQVYSLDREEILYERGATQLLIPASNTKIITAAVYNG
jgi:D-alanyl-D-alanine carboxypeptidase